MSPTESASEIAALKREISRANRAYHELDSPEISDSEYDRLFRRLQELELAHPELVTADSPTHRVGGAPAESLTKSQHAAPMLSLDNAFNTDELLAWHDKLVRIDSAASSAALLLEVKIDGAALSLTYEDGSLIRAVSRGNGVIGEEITGNAKAISDIPLQLDGDGWPSLMEVRGEVYIPRLSFSKVNVERESSGLDPFQNPRNAAAGALRALNPAEARHRRLRFFAYQAVPVVGQFGMQSQNDTLEALTNWGFPVEPHRTLVKGIVEAANLAEEWSDRIRELPFDADGLVVKIDDTELQGELGVVGGRVPRWAIARKFPAESAFTRLLAIEVNIGRTGALSPTAVLEPVRIGGVTVTRATLHNEDVIALRDVRVGDLVELIRSGDVIPKVLGSVASERPEESTPWAPPENCPYCQTALVRPEGEANRYCPNQTCPGRSFESLVHFVSKAGMEIQGLGPERIRQLLSEGMITNAADLYRLDSENLVRLEGFASQSATGLVAAIEDSRSRPLRSLLSALGIRHLGTVAAKAVARRFGSMEALRSASADEIKTIDGVGPAISGSINEFLNEPGTALLLVQLESLAVAQVEPEAMESGARSLDGKVVVLTGTSSRSRSELTALIESAGGTLKSSVSKRTDFVVAGDDAGSKLGRAQELGVEVIDEDELLLRLGLAE